MTLAALALLLPVVSMSYPSIFVNTFLGAHNMERCTEHPDKAYGGHSSPVLSNDVAFTTRAVNGLSVATSLCQGRSYAVEIDLPGSVQWLFTASVGRFEGNSQTCPNRLFSGRRTGMISATLELPCTPILEPVELKVTFASGSSSGFRTARVELPVDPNCECTSEDESEPTASGTESELDAPDNIPEAPAEQTCPPSQLGYQCRQPFGDVVLHFSWRSSSLLPPPNVCTGEQQSTAQDADRPDGSIAMAHWAVESPYSGYVSVAFAENRGRMVPAEAIMGGVDSSGRAYIDTYRLTAYSLPPPRNSDTDWAKSTGAVQLGNGSTIICFSTELPTGPSARRKLFEGPRLELGNGGLLQMNWAVHKSSDDRSQTHDARGSFVLDPTTGAIDVIVSNKRKWVLAHSILMALAFILFMPTGMLLARHRSLYATAKLGPKPVWFWAHLSTQILGTVCFVAGIAISLSRFGGNYPEGYKDLGRAHWVIGVLLIPFLGVQILPAVFLRPKPPKSADVPPTTLRRVWEFLHHNWGRLISALAVANVYIGIVLYDRIWGGSRDLAAWAASVTAFLGVLLLLDLALTVVSVVRGRQASSMHAGTAETGLEEPSKEGLKLPADGRSLP